MLAGVGFFGAYALTLAALRLAPAASVSAVRESSVVMATAFLAISGREQIGAERLAGAIAVVVGNRADLARLAAVWSARNQTLPDRIAGIIVVRD